MIDTLIALLEVAMDAPVATRYGVATGRDPVLVHISGAEYHFAANDKNGDWSYWRVGTITGTQRDIYQVSPGVQYNIPLRYVMCLEKDCGESALLSTLGARVRGAIKEARSVLEVIGVEVISTAEVVEGVAQQEGVPNIVMQRTMLALDMVIQVVANAKCLPTCGEPIDITCRILQLASDAKIIECLGSRLDDICGEGGDCVDCSEAADTANVQVLGDGEEAGVYVYQSEGNYLREDGWYIASLGEGTLGLFDASDGPLFYTETAYLPWNGIWYDLNTGDPGPEVACEGGFPVPYPPQEECVCPVSITLNNEEVRTSDNVCQEPIINLLLQDQDGNPVPFTLDFMGRIIINVTAPEMPYILPYDDATAASADGVTVPTELQAVLLRDTKRQYPGNGTSTVADLIASGRFLIPATDDVNFGLITTVGIVDHQIQTNEI